MEKTIFEQKLDAKRQNSFWYKGLTQIAKFTKDDREIIISLCGEIRCKFLNENFYRKNEQAVYLALSLDLFDADLKKIEFDECNWFDFTYKNSKMKEWEDIEGDERFTYSSALKAAKEYLDDDEFWDNSNRRTT